MKSISIKTDDTTFSKLQLITFKASTERKQKVYMKDIILEAIDQFTFSKYSGYLAQPEIKQTKPKKPTISEITEIEELPKTPTAKKQSKKK